MNADTPLTHRLPFLHAVAEGSAREVGAQQARYFLAAPESADFFTSPPPGRAPQSHQTIDQAITFFDRHCPGLNEEIEGFAAALGVQPSHVVFYALSFDPPPFELAGQCSHAVLLPDQTEDGHLRVIRNYEFSHEMSDRRLATVRVAGRPAHIGFSEVCFGRDDGMNAHGLCVTMSAGAPMAPFEGGGCMFWVLVRTILDRCATVEEALEVIADVPLSFNLNLLLADRDGHAARVELASSHRAIRRAEPGETFLAATNHFTLPEMKAYDLARMWNSGKRQETMAARFAECRTSVDAAKRLLSEPVPQGLCAYDYSGFFGTLWSEVFDVTAGTVDICFGPPSHNPWFTFDLQTPVGQTAYEADLPDIPADNAFWSKLPPGGGV